MIVLENKLHPVAPRREWVERRRLIASLIEGADNRLILIDAPIGYGKTTLLAQWGAAQAEARPFAWVTLDPADNDPVRLWTYVVEALQSAAPQLGERMTRVLSDHPRSLTEILVPQLVKELAILPRRVVLVLDDYHQIRDEACHESVDLLIRNIPHTLQLVIATRSDPPLDLGRLRATNEMLEVRAEELRFNREEAAMLIRATLGHELPAHELARLVNRTEGWPAGFYLAALSLQGRTETALFVERFAGDNRHVADYLTMEVLDKQPDEMRRFLVRSSILDRFNTSLCAAVVGVDGSKEMIEHLERSNLFLVSMDDRREWYRYHRLFQDLLRSELRRSEPDLIPELHRRASAWHRKWGFLGEAVAHAIAARDLSAVRQLISSNWFPYWEAGRLDVVRSWLNDLGHASVASDPVLAIVAAWIAALSDRLAEVEEWLAVVERETFDGRLPDGASSLESASALIRSLFGYTGVGAALEEARRAVELEPRTEGRWRSLALMSLGYYLYLSGDSRRAIASFHEVTQQKSTDRASVIFALAQLSMVAAEEDRRSDAESLAREAFELIDELGLSENPIAAAAHAALGRKCIAMGDPVAAGDHLERALELCRRVPWLQPWLTLQILVALTPVRAVLSDRQGALELLEDAWRILRSNPDAGILVNRIRGLEAAFDTPVSTALGEPLTGRELAVLRLLPSSLTQREIGEQLFLSINTVKSHTQSIFRKLGVESRTQAVAKARKLALL